MGNCSAVRYLNMWGVERCGSLWIVELDLRKKLVFDSWISFWFVMSKRWFVNTILLQINFICCGVFGVRLDTGTNSCVLKACEKFSTCGGKQYASLEETMSWESGRAVKLHVGSHVHFWPLILECSELITEPLGHWNYASLWFWYPLEGFKCCKISTVTILTA